MKGVLGLFLIVIPFAWYYIKHYSKKAAVRMETSLFLERLYDALLKKDMDRAANLYFEFASKASRDADYTLYLDSLPFSVKNETCLNFMKGVAEGLDSIETDQLLNDFIDQPMQNFLHELYASLLKDDLDEAFLVTALYGKRAGPESLLEVTHYLENAEHTREILACRDYIRYYLKLEKNKEELLAPLS